jgi:hypothetical protein
MEEKLNLRTPLGSIVIIDITPYNPAQERTLPITSPHRADIMWLRNNEIAISPEVRKSELKTMRLCKEQPIYFA